MGWAMGRVAMPGRVKERLPFLANLTLSLLLLWQARGLDSWSILGPGPGLFPQLTTAFCAVVAGLLVLFPGLARTPDKSAEDGETEIGPAERRLFLAYGLALPFLALASVFTGFIAMSAFLALALTWGAERRSWRGALVFGLLCGLAGVVGFDHLLGASVPATVLEQSILRLFR
ncbi:MAG: tripartite tricarboxylate transporter TctB family protein [Alphaproteobacteria bacterium]|nr:tripartite tricarboxylate transporter TctB family protein [Alphaproteobacteria bacterium]